MTDKHVTLNEVRRLFCSGDPEAIVTSPPFGHITVGNSKKFTKSPAHQMIRWFAERGTSIYWTSVARHSTFSK